jgi:uroporphyrinogen-III synthase
VRRLFAVAREDDREDLLRAGLRRTAIGAVGPVVAGELLRQGTPASIVPDERFFLKPLVSALVAALSR